MIISYSFHGFKILISSSFCKYTRFLTFHQIFQTLFHLNSHTPLLQEGVGGGSLHKSDCPLCVLFKTYAFGCRKVTFHRAKGDVSGGKR